MAKRTDENENAIIEGTLSIIHSDTNGDGDIEVSGVVYTDNIKSNTLSGLILNVNDVGFLDNIVYLNEKTDTVVVPEPTKSGFYVKDTTLKSISSTGVITTYQPTTTKGDITVHNGTTQTRLPLGPNDYILQVDSSTSTGLKWVPLGVSNISNQEYSVVLIGQNNSQLIFDDLIGAFYVQVSTKSRSGPLGIFFSTKNNVINYGHIARVTSEGLLNLEYNPYEGVRLYKEITQGDGEYTVKTNTNFTENTVTLTTTLWSTVSFTGNFGAYSISVSNNILGPSATFLLAKSTQTHNSSNIIKISSSPSSDSGYLEIRWNANSTVEIRKTTNNHDGVYSLVENFSNSTNTLINLSGTTYSEIPSNFYEKRSVCVKITNDVSGYPCSIFYLSKKEKVNHSSKFSVFSPGNTTLEKISIDWNPLELIKIKKSGSNFDGNYNLYVY